MLAKNWVEEEYILIHCILLLMLSRHVFLGQNLEEEINELDSGVWVRYLAVEDYSGASC